jgi:3-oxoacyl-[acyl-carrier-protein] synthase II
MSRFLDHAGRPIVAVTGIGLVTPLGIGVDDNWDALRAGRSGITRISRFPLDHLRTTIAGTVTLPGVDLAALTSSGRVERYAARSTPGSVTVPAMVVRR